MSRLSPRSIARQINRQVTLPQRMLRELRWAVRDIRDLQAEIRRFVASSMTFTPQPPKQAESTDPRDIAHDGF